MDSHDRTAVRRGASLVETMVVFVVVALLVALSASLIQVGIRFAHRLEAQANGAKKHVKSASNGARSKGRPIPGQYLVLLNDTADVQDTINRISQQIPVRVVHRYAHVFKGFAIQMPASATPQLLADPAVRYVEQDQTLVLAKVREEKQPASIRRINVPLSPTSAPGIDVDIAIIDTGVDLSNDAVDVVFRQGFGCSSDANDTDGHGTQVACIIAATAHRSGVVGVAPGARVWALKVANDGASGSASNLIAALDFLALHAREIEVANISVATTKHSVAVNAAAAACVRAGVTVVAAAGNSRSDVANASPASEPSVLTVGALADTDGRLGGYGPKTTAGDADDTVASFSNVGPGVDFVAPAVQIETLDLANEPSKPSGTSFAAAHVTGVAARILGGETFVSVSRDVTAPNPERMQSLLRAACKERIPGPGRQQPYDVISGGAVANQQAPAAVAGQRPSGLPLRYEVNWGQTDPRVRFLARSKGSIAWLTADGIVIGNGSAAQRMLFGNANPNPQIIGQNRLPGAANYFIGNDPSKWRTVIPCCREVIYDDVYPGIDVVFHSDQQRVRYDFMVAPGADPSAIALEFPDAEYLHVNPAGTLFVTFAGRAGTMHQPAPVIYQAGAHGPQTVRGRFVAVGPKQVRFELGEYDRTRELIIDPIVYSTFLGGNSGDEGYAVTTDGAGNVYISGVTASSNFPLQTPFDGSLASTDAFVTKMDPTGTTVLYSTYLGGSSSESSAYAAFGFGNALAVDGGGNAFVSTSTASTDFPVLGAAQPLYGGGTGDAFLTKLNPSGSGLVFSTYLGSNSYEEGRSIALDGGGNAYLAGLVSGGTFPTTVGAKQTTYAGGANDGFVTKYSPLGAVVYSTLLGGNGDDQCCAVAVRGGNAYVTGGASSANFPIAGAVVQPGFGGTYDCFVSQLDAAGSNLVYSTFLGGVSTDFGRAIVVDGGGNAYVGVETGSTNFPVTGGVMQPVFGGGTRDGNITKLNATASARFYSTFLGGSATDFIIGLTVDGAGNSYVTGLTGSGNFPQFGGFQGFAGNDDAFVTVVNAAGTGMLFSSFLGGAGTDRGLAITFASFTDIIAVGWTDSTAFPSKLPYQAIYGGGTTDVFITRVTPTISSAGVTLVSGATSVKEGGATSGYGVVLNSAPTANVTVTFNPGTQLTVFPPALTFTPGNWSTVQGVAVFAVDDALIEGPHTAPITHTAVSADLIYNGIAIVNLTVSITDNDSAPPGTLYGITWTSPQLITINTATGAGTSVGAVATAAPIGLGFRGNNLYTFGLTGLMREVNPGTAAIMNTITVPSMPGAGNEGDFAFRSDGIGFMENGGLHRFDVAPPSCTLLNAAVDMDGLAFNSAGVLYGLSEGGGQLVIFNQLTGVGTPIGNTGITPVKNFGGLAFDAGDNLFAAVSTAAGPSTLYRIDLATGLATPVGNIGFNEVSGITFSPGLPLGEAPTPPDGAETSENATSLGMVTTAKLYRGLDTYRRPSGRFDDDWYSWTMSKSGSFTIDLKMTKAVCCGPKGQLKGVGDVHFRMYRVIGGNLIELAASQTSGTKTLSVNVAQGERILVWAYGLYFTQAEYDIIVDLQ